MSITDEELMADFDSIDDITNEDEVIVDDVVVDEETDEDDVIVDDEIMLDDDDSIDIDDDDTEIVDEDEEEVIDDDEEEVTYQLKVDGESVQVTLDELKKGYNTTKGANNRFEEAAKLKEEATAITEMLKKDPVYILEQMFGVEQVEKLAESYLSNKILLDSMTDDERETHDAKTNLQKVKLENEELRLREEERQQTVAREEFTGRINTALDEVELPQNDFTTRRMAYYMLEALQSDDQKIKALTDVDIAELVFEDFKDEIRSLPVDKIETLLGKDVANEMRRNEVKKHGKKKVVKRSKTPVKKGGKKGDTDMSWDDYQKYLDSIK